MRTKSGHTTTRYKFGPALLAEIDEKGSVTVERAHEIAQSVQKNYERDKTSFLIAELLGRRKIRKVNGEYVKP